MTKIYLVLASWFTSMAEIFSTLAKKNEPKPMAIVVDAESIMRREMPRYNRYNPNPFIDHPSERWLEISNLIVEGLNKGEHVHLKLGSYGRYTFSALEAMATYVILHVLLTKAELYKKFSYSHDRLASLEETVKFCIDTAYDATPQECLRTLEQYSQQTGAAFKMMEEPWPKTIYEEKQMGYISSKNRLIDQCIEIATKNINEEEQKTNG